MVYNASMEMEHKFLSRLDAMMMRYICGTFLRADASHK